EAMVRNGDLPIAMILPAGLDSTFGRFGGERPAIEVLADPSDPIAPQMAAGLLQKAAMTAAPDAIARHGFEVIDRYAEGLTPTQRKAMEIWLPAMRAQADSAVAGAGGAGSDDGGFSGLVPVR